MAQVDEETYKFQIIEFLTPGPKKGNKASIDIIPSSWISFDPKKGKIVAIFMPPPYDVESIDLLYKLVKTEGKAPESWPTYPVKIRGHAKTYADAMKRLKVLESEDFAFTPDTDGDQETRAKKVESKFKAKKLSVSEETKKAMQVLAFASDSEEKSDNYQDSTSSDEFKNERKKPPSQPGPRYKTIIRTPPPKPKNVNPRVHKSVILEKQKPHTQHKVPTSEKPTSSAANTNKTGAKGNDKSCNREKKNSKEVQAPVDDEEHNNKSNERNNRKSHKDRKSDMVAIISMLKGIVVDLQEIKANQQVIMQQVQPTDQIENFTTKHHFDLPFKTKADFLSFDDELRTNEELRLEFISSLSCFVDRELCLVKSCTNVFRKYTSREVIMQFTPTRKMPGKSLIRPTMFYDSVMGVMKQTHKDVRTGMLIGEQAFLNALGKVFNNAKDWNGQRQKRVKLQGPEPKSGKTNLPREHYEQNKQGEKSDQSGESEQSEESEQGEKSEQSAQDEQSEGETAADNEV